MNGLIKPLRGKRLIRNHPLARGLIAGWLMNEGTGNKIFDISGNQFTGAFVNNIGWGFTERGIVVDFQGANGDYISCGDQDLFTPTSRGFSIVGRFKANTLPPEITGNRMWIASKGAASNFEWGVHINDYDSDFGKLAFSYWSSGGLGKRVRSATSLSAGVWYHYVFTLSIPSGGTTPICYLDGKLDYGSESGGSPTVANLSAEMRIGGRADNWAWEFDGVQSELFLYNRVLTANQAQWIYQEPFAMFETRRIMPVVGGAFFVSISDSIGITDTIDTALEKVVEFDETIGITDNLSVIGTYIKVLTEALGITDTINTMRNLKKALADDIGITDTSTILKSAVISFTDTIGITDVLSIIIFKLVSLADLIGITDVLSKISTFIKNIANNIGITDVLSKIGIFKRNITDNIGISDTLIADVLQVVIGLADTIGITDTISVVRSFVKSMFDSIGITDVISKVGIFKRNIFNTVGITDTISNKRNIILNIADTIGITDIINTFRILVIDIADLIGIIDAISILTSIKVQLADTVGITDVLSKIGTFIRNIFDSIGIIDIILNALTGLIDSFGLSKIISILRPGKPSITKSTDGSLPGITDIDTDTTPDITGK